MEGQIPADATVYDTSGVETDYGNLALDEHQAPQGTPDPASAPTEPPPPAAASAETPAPAIPSEFAINRNGELIKVPATDPRVQQWLSQGYDYAQRMGELHRERQAYEQQQKALQERFGAVDEFVRTPEGQQWWSQVQNQWAQRQQEIQNNPALREISALKQELGEIKSFKDSVVEAQRQAQIQQEDRQLNEQIESVRKEYTDIDLNAVDPASGQTLLQRVGKFAIENNLTNFAHAFRLFNHDALVTRAANQAREAAAKDIQAKRKAGLIGTTQSPVKGVTRAENVKNKSYEQLIEEGLSELQSSKGA